MQILLAMTVYQIIISGKLPETSASVPIIGQVTAVEINHKVRILQLPVRKIFIRVFSNYCKKA